MISFLIPTNRIKTHPNVVNNCINSIINLHQNHDIEILIFTQEIFSHSNKCVKIIKEIGRQGPIYGFNKMAIEALGDIIVCMTDDNILLLNCYNYIDIIKDVGISGLNNGGQNIIPQKGDKLGDQPLNVEIPYIQNIRWPVISKNFLLDKLNGFIFHPDLFYHAGDIYLSFYLHKIGVVATEHVAKITQPINLKDSTFENQDCNTVRSLIENFDINKHYLQKSIINI